MVLPTRTLRAISIVIPLFTALLLLGIIEAVTGLKIDENLFQSSVTLGMISGLMNIILLILVYRHRVP